MGHVAVTYRSKYMTPRVIVTHTGAITYSAELFEMMPRTSMQEQA
jgi:hypothetical protein